MMKPVGLLVCVMMMSVPGADDLRALIEEALDQPVQMEIEDRPLADAFETIAEQTGVQLTISPWTLELLPYGENTKVSATMRNISLREGLSSLAAPLGLEFEVRERSIEVLPKSALLRIGRQATWDELDTLAALNGTDFQGDASAIDRLGGKLQFRIGQTDGWPPLRAAIQRVGAGPGDEVLTLACDSLDWTWYPWGKQITVVPKSEQLRRQLDWPVSIRLSHRKLMEALQAIGQQAGVTVRAEPGAIASLPLQTRENFSLYLENKTASDALELVSATTGLGYRVEADAVVFYQPGAASAGPEPAEGGSRRTSGPYVGKIALPPSPDGTQVEIFIRESDLSAETNRLRKKYIERADEAIRKALQDLEQSSAP
ncbi:MAG TPA: hypothetical protein VM243_07705 [Phycisphaerae bacterium]|nr:hypothetical protein [Phycisphaerae bacterium]